MRLQRQAERAVIMQDMLAERHDGELCFRLQIPQPDVCPIEQRQCLGGAPAVKRPDRPERSAAVEADGTESVGICQALDLPHVEARAQPDVADGSVAGAAPHDERLHALLGKALDLVEAEPYRPHGPYHRPHLDMARGDARRIEPAGDQGAVPIRMVDVGRLDLDAVILRVADELGRGIEAHRLRVQDRGAEHVGIESLEPAGGIDEQREGRGVAFGEAVIAEAFDLAEAALGEFLFVAVFDHAVDEILPVAVDRAVAAEGGHRATQLVGLAGRKASGVDGDLHRLFLEQRHATGPFQDRLKHRARVVDLLQAHAATQIGMHHVALDGAGPDDRDLDDEIVEFPRFQARQHRHLGARFDLEDAQRIGAADHVVDAGIFLFHRRQRDRPALVVAYPIMVFQKREGALHARQHAERQNVDLEQADGVEVVLVPLDHLAFGHRRFHDRDDLVEPILGNDETADMLRQVAWAFARHEFVGAVDDMAGNCLLEVEAAGLRLRFAELRRPPAPDGTGERAARVLGKAHRLADLAQRRAAAIGNDGGRQRRALLAVFLVDVSDDLVAVLMLEIDVDVGRLVALGRDESLQQQVHTHEDRVHCSNAEAETDDGIGCRSASLAEHVRLFAGIADEVVHGEEIARVFFPGDERQFLRDQIQDLFRDAFRIATMRAFPGQPFQFGLRIDARFGRLLGIVVLQLAERKFQL